MTSLISFIRRNVGLNFITGFPVDCAELKISGRTTPVHNSRQLQSFGKFTFTHAATLSVCGARAVQWPAGPRILNHWPPVGGLLIQTWPCQRTAGAGGGRGMRLRAGAGAGREGGSALL